jgi:hypothetical protein
MLGERQRADEKVAQDKAKTQELLELLAAVEKKSAELNQVLNAAPRGTFREPMVARNPLLASYPCSRLILLIIR